MIRRGRLRHIGPYSGITTRQYYDLSGRNTGYSEISSKSGHELTHTVGYEFDDINNLTQLVEDINGTEKTTSYTYDEDNRTTAVTTDGTTVEYTYDFFGRVTQQVTKNGDTVILTEVFEFNNPTTSTTSSQVESYTTYKGAVSDANLIAQYKYTYDDNCNITVIDDGANETRYTYDSANQLIREDNEKTGKSYTWTYDNAGNILSHQSYTYTTGALGVPDPYPSAYTYSDALWGDLLTSWNGKNVIYEYKDPEIVINEDGTTKTINNIGNPKQIGDREFEWEHGRQLKKLTDGDVENGGTVWTYSYNNAGLRTGRTSNSGTTYSYIYDGSALVQMTVDSQTASFTYDINGTPLTMKVGENTYYYITNLQGDVIALVNVAGTTVVNYSYTAYGIVTTSGDANIAALNPLTYRGYVYDAETGLFYLQSRYYDPEIGRFLNRDDLAYLGADGSLLSYNLFTYCGNNPVTGFDPLGTINWGNIFKAAAVVVAVTAVVALTVATAGFAAVAAGAISSTVAIAATTGAVVGGLTAGAAEIVSQCQTRGSENLDYTSIGIETATGSLNGAIDGVAATTSGSVKYACKGGKALVNTARAFAHSAHQGDNVFASSATAAAATTALQGASLLLKSGGSGGYGAGAIFMTALFRVGANVWRHKDALLNKLQNG